MTLKVKDLKKESGLTDILHPTCLFSSSLSLSLYIYISIYLSLSLSLSRVCCCFEVAPTIGNKMEQNIQTLMWRLLRWRLTLSDIQIGHVRHANGSCVSFAFGVYADFPRSPGHRERILLQEHKHRFKVCFHANMGECISTASITAAGAIAMLNKQGEWITMATTFTPYLQQVCPQTFP